VKPRGETVSVPRARSGWQTVEEVLAAYATDPDFQRKRAEQEAGRQEHVRGLRAAEVPIVQELNDAGVEVSSVWDLVNTSVPYPDALPILLRHLQKGGYPDWVMASLGRALAVKPALFAWGALRDLYLAATGPNEEEGLALALSASATADQFEQLLLLLHDESRRETRGHFLRAIKRVGGDEGKAVLESLTSDPRFGKEATAILKRRKR
jgi:hypothetical protein